MGKGKLGEVLYEAGRRAALPLDVLLWANGTHLMVNQDPDVPRMMSFLIGGSERNIGVVAAMQKLYEMSSVWGSAPDDLIAFIHDDLLIQQGGGWPQWDLQVIDAFKANPKMGLAGFHGASWLGQPSLYVEPYELIQLARGGCGSNMKDAEVHGERWYEARRVACVDGFSLICRRSFLDQIGGWSWFPKDLPHHVYDTSLACMAARHGWETWFLPIACHHLGGQTATKVDYLRDFGRTEGEIHAKGHEWMYGEFRDVLPLRVP